jgi:protein MAK11
MDRGLEVLVGTYEELTLGYISQFNEKPSTFVNSFTDHSHTASVKAVAVSPNGIAATGSADETIKLFNLQKRTELGSLIHHQGSVTGLLFFGISHMFSWSEDGTIAVWQVGSWECLRTLQGHKSAVYSFTVHPSGKLALSCSKDRTLRTWNLMTGRCAYVSNLKEVADTVLWSVDGSTYLTVVGSRVDIYAFETAAIVHQIHTINRVTSVVFLSADILAVGCEKGIIIIHSLTVFQNLLELTTGTNRVKAMAVAEQPYLVIASSDGFVNLYHFQLGKELKFEKVIELNTGFRLLCASVRTFPNSSCDSNTSCTAVMGKADHGTEEKDFYQHTMPRKQLLNGQEVHNKKTKLADREHKCKCQQKVKVADKQRHHSEMSASDIFTTKSKLRKKAIKSGKISR